MLTAEEQKRIANLALRWVRAGRREARAEWQTRSQQEIAKDDMQRAKAELMDTLKEVG